MFERYGGECTAQTLGVILDIQTVGMDTASWRVTVEYQVGGQVFRICEWAKLVSETVRMGPFPIGQRKKPKIPGMVVGGTVVVCYNPFNPSMAYLRDNVGFTSE